MLAQANVARMDAVFAQFHDTVDCFYPVDSELLTEKIQLGEYVNKSKIYTTLVMTV